MRHTKQLECENAHALVRICHKNASENSDFEMGKKFYSVASLDLLRVSLKVCAQWLANNIAVFLFSNRSANECAHAEV